MVDVVQHPFSFQTGKVISIREETSSCPECTGYVEQLLLSEKGSPGKGAEEAC